MLLEEKYKGYLIFAYDKFFIEIGKNVIDKEYKEFSILKNTKRNYVSEIQINNINYIKNLEMNILFLKENYLLYLKMVKH